MSEKVISDMSFQNLSDACKINHVDKKDPSDIATQDDLETESALIQCSNCLTLNLTRVEEENILSDERTWAMFCGCFGSCYGIFSILFGKNHTGFMKYSHHCGSCNTVIGVYQPKSSTKMKCIVIFSIIVIVTLKIVIFVFIFLPHL